MRQSLRSAIAVLIAMPAASALAQSFNIEFGPAGSAVPPSTYAAVGWPGVWNTFSSRPRSLRAGTLRGLLSCGQPFSRDLLEALAVAVQHGALARQVLPAEDRHVRIARVDLQPQAPPA